MNRFNAFIYEFSSLKTSLWCMAIYFILVLVGTFAQIDHGIFYVQKVYFHSWFIYIPFKNMSIPIFPGGALVGLVLVINLILSTIIRIKWSVKKTGIILIHIGLIVLLLGAGMTSCINKESQLYLKEGDSSFFSNDTQNNELAIIDISNPQYDFTVSIPAQALKTNSTISHPKLPFSISVLYHVDNSQIFPLKDNIMPIAQSGIGQHLTIKEIAPFTSDDLKNNETALISFSDSNTTFPSMLVALDINGTQVFTYNNKPYYIQLRPKRYYFPFLITLKTFTEELYPGSKIPKSYSSLVELTDFKTQEKRDVLIYMNHPLRHEFFTFFQASFGQDEPSSVLQIVYSPIWLLPYISCLIITIGMVLQFMVYFKKRKKTS